jgi:putative nucleotidyltransferase with HDIG domain
MEADTQNSEKLARDRESALALLHEWTESEALRRHAYAVEAAVRAYARRRGADEDAWGCVALLHDFDYERHPTLDKHPQDGAPHLRELGYPDWFVRAILSHAGHLQDSSPRESDLEHVLFACDELAGFVHACALVRPEGLSTLEPRSVRKKLKQKSFASGVHREDVIEGAQELGVDLDEHIMIVIEALRPIAGELGVPEGQRPG